MFAIHVLICFTQCFDDMAIPSQNESMKDFVVIVKPESILRLYTLPWQQDNQLHLQLPDCSTLPSMVRLAKGS